MNPYIKRLWKKVRVGVIETPFSGWKPVILPLEDTRIDKDMKGIEPFFDDFADRCQSN